MQIPTVGTFRFINGVRRHGFLDFVGQQWRSNGDLFQVRLGGRPRIFAMHPDVVERVNISHRHNYDKRASYEPMRKYLLGDGLVASTGDLWRRQRRLLAPFYQPRGVQAYAGLMLRDGARLAEHWQRLAAGDAEVDMFEEMTNVSASIILGAMFSTETMEDIHRIKAAVETMLSFTEVRMRGVAPPHWLPTPANRRYRAARALVNRSVYSLIAERRATGEATWPDDLLARLMRSRDEDTGAAMPESLLLDESVTTFVAGHETTARTLSFAWYALARNPAAAAKLHEELDRVLGGKPPTVEQLQQLPYTLQVVKEVMRLYPAVPFYARDAVAPDQVSGVDVSPGASVMLSPYFTHRHPGFWDDPETFDPGRWTREAEAARHAYAYHPFAAGPRVCIGNTFAMLETRLLLVMLAQHFAPKLRAGLHPRFEMQGALGIVGGLPMTIAAR